MGQLIIISGRSGSGKTIALHSLEDLDFYCIDNLPINLVPLLHQATGKLHPKIAISLDSRNLTTDLDNINKILEVLAQHYKVIDLIYLDANEDRLLQRFSDTRRKHPLTKKNTNITLREAIVKEREMLSAITSVANFILDTTNLTQHELYGLIRARVNRNIIQGELTVLLQSFGFKYGLPADADFVFDVRSLPNPYWIPNLKQLTGLDPKVIEFLNQSNIVSNMYNKLMDFIKENLIYLNNEHRSYVTIALGCTGGRHRSVYLAEKIAANLRTENLNLAEVQIRHRELTKV